MFFIAEPVCMPLFP